MSSSTSTPDRVTCRAGQRDLAAAAECRAPRGTTCRHADAPPKSNGNPLLPLGGEEPPIGAGPCKPTSSRWLAAPSASAEYRYQRARVEHFSLQVHSGVPAHDDLDL